MMIRFVVFFVVAAVFAPFAAKASTLSQMRTNCQIGTDPQPSGSMPMTEDGVVVISAAEAKCVLDRFKDVVLIEPMFDKQQIPGSNLIVSLARSPGDAEARAKYLPHVKKLTGGDLSRPVMVYCHHSSCQYSHNAAINLRELGYRNILWFRPGLKEWDAKKYPLVAARDLRMPLDLPAYARLFGESEKLTFACFGEKKVEACDKKYELLQQAVATGDGTASEREKLYGELFNTGAVRAENFREAGNPRAALEAIKPLYALLVERARQSAKPGTLSDNSKVVREYALDSLELNRPGDVTAMLDQVRKDGEASFARLPATAKGSAERKTVQSSMVAMEHLEREIAEYSAKRAIELYKSSKPAQALPFRRLAEKSLDRARIWIDRNGKEGIGRFLDRNPPYRLAELMMTYGDLELAAGDKQGAGRVYKIGSNAICGVVPPEDVKKLLNKQKFDDMGRYLDARQCYLVETSYYMTTPEYEKMIREQAEKELEFYKSLLKQ